MSPAEPLTIVTLRHILMGILVLGLVGTGTELMLLGHIDGWQQLVPVALIGLGLLVLGWHGITRRAQGLRALRWTMSLFVASGFIGTVLHYRGNVEFALETYRTLAGWELFREAMTGATPALSPGTMIELGLVGLAYTYRHPMLTRDAEDSPF